MKIFINDNVLEASLKRIRYLFDEFEEIVVGFSGGKDSTVVLNLAIMVAREKNRLPIKVMFLDQEAEWETNIEYIRKTMKRPEVIPMWYQVPIRLQNATSHSSDWLWCWKEGDEWIRDKEEISIKDNVYGKDRFHEMFGAILKHDFKNKKTAYLAGVRAEEAPKRLVSLTSNATYKWITWGKKFNDIHYTFYPIYDWSYTDVWKVIDEKRWDYCKIYDLMYRYGVAAKDMRVSNLHHETAIHALYFLQEIEPDNWNKLTRRLQGIDTTAKLEKTDSFNVKDLPFMFSSWKEYRDYLLENLLEDEGHKASYRKKFKSMDKDYLAMKGLDDMFKVQIRSILSNDFEFTKIINWERSPDVYNFRQWLKRQDDGGYLKYKKYIPSRKVQDVK
jgi:predicted phosphoadenosine phosphosulfate sulfurtransferase